MGPRIQNEEAIVVKCMHCQGQMKKGFAPLQVDRNGNHLSLDAVPAWVCSQCGEPYFEEREVWNIQRLLRGLGQVPTAGPRRSTSPCSAH